MDPAHTSLPQSSFVRLEGILQQRESIVANTTAEAHQSACHVGPAIRNSDPASDPIPLPPSLALFHLLQYPHQSPRCTKMENHKVAIYSIHYKLLYPVFPAALLYMHTSEEAKVAFTINHLRGRLQLWGTAEWDSYVPGRLGPF